ncbi:hypothetical protein [Avibacterium paragallinarum]|nr:hypothetical protein [Avibacterium paragallinarum]
MKTTKPKDYKHTLQLQLTTELVKTAVQNQTLPQNAAPITAKTIK